MNWKLFSVLVGVMSSALLEGRATPAPIAPPEPLPPFSAEGYRVIKSAGPCMPLDNGQAASEPHIELDPRRSPELLAQMEARVDEPYCWYLMFGGSLRLWAGVFCDGPIEAIFSLHEGKWVKVVERKTATLCHQRG